MTKYRWIICALLFFATTVNYLDRQVFSLLQPVLTDIYKWTNSDYANITSAFTFMYAVFTLLVGRYVDNLGTKKGYALAITVWSLGACIHAFVYFVEPESKMTFLGFAMPVSVFAFMICRAVLALGEAGNFPAAIKTVAEWFPKKERSLATGIFNSGANIGAIVAPLLVPVIAKYWGWQWAFVAVGAIGFLWLILWFSYYGSPKEMLAKGKINNEEFQHINSDEEQEKTKDDPEENDSDKKKVSWFSLLGYRQTWSFTMGKFLTDGVWWFFLFWMPSYLKNNYGMSTEDMMLPLAVLYSMTMFGSIGGGYLPKIFQKDGRDPYKSRMRAMLTIAIFPLVVLLAQPLSDISYWLPVILIGIGCSAHQAWSANIYTTVSDMFPKKTVASIVGIGTMAGSLSGVITSKIGGWLFDYYGAQGSIETGYTIMFVFCAIAYLLGWTVMKLLVPKYKIIEL